MPKGKCRDPSLFENSDSNLQIDDIVPVDRRKMREPFGRIDSDPQLHKQLLPYCRLKRGEVWTDPVHGHQVAVIDSTDQQTVRSIIGCRRIGLCLADPPYNVIVGAQNTVALSQLDPSHYDEFSERWVSAILPMLHEHSSFYVWLGADPKNGFHPFPEFCIAMRKFPEWKARNWITVRNQRGYGTQHNWMWVRQELLYYVKGKPAFDVRAEYTDIPKILKGYYKEVAGEITENSERGKSDTIRAGNVWIDIQQVFYRLRENVPGCYAQKPLKAIERIIASASVPCDVVLDPFAHSGTTLIAAERQNRISINFEIDPVFAEVAIRRLERFRSTGEPGWQCSNPFPETFAR